MSANKELLEALGIDLKRITISGKTVCPKCSHERKRKNDPCLSVNVPDGSYKCHNCDWKGRVFEKTIYEKKVYIKPVFNNRTSLTKNLVDWFAGRSIVQQTLIDFKITEGSEWMPQVFDLHLKRLMDAGTDKEIASKEAHKLARVNTVQFNYFRDTELINVKYRDGSKNFKLAKDAELIFYNISAIKDSDECMICEGEIDAMSWHQAGYLPVISVPNGASKNQKLEYLENCFEFFEHKTKIYLSTDDDIPGHALRDELARRLGTERCYKIDFEGLKDANEYLHGYGPEKLLKRIGFAKEYPITGVYSINDLWGGVMDYYHNGLPEGDRTGDGRLDEHLRFMPGELTMVTGIPSHGKSIFLEQVSIKLCLNAGWSFGVFSPECYPIEIYILRLIKQIIGKPANPRNITEADMDKMREWLLSRFNVIFPEDENFLLDTILEKARQLVFRKGINGLIIDPWNRIESNMPNGFSESKYTAEQLIKIVRFNQRNGVHTFLVAHPTKMPKNSEGVFEIPNLYNISGSAHFFNITQNGFTVYRNSATGLTDVHIQKVKWEHLGKKGKIEYRYCEHNTRLLPPFATQTEVSAGKAVDDFTCWIPGIQEVITAPVQPGFQFPQSTEQIINWSPPDEDIEVPF